MYGIGIDPRWIGAVAAVVAIFFGGWWINGWRWEAKFVSLEKSYAEQVIEAQRAARRKEAQLQSQMDIQQVIKNAEIKDIRTQLDSALVELRKRPSRMPVPDTTGAAKGATGAELSREDAEFLAREAARADSVIAQLKYCYKMYDEARDILNKGNP